MKIIKQNLNKLGLEIVPHKTILVHFNNQGIKPGSVEIKIDNIIIKSRETARYLGVTFDYQLSFKRHLENTRNRCLKALNIIKYVRGTWWGTNPSTLLTIYKSYIRSIAEYACFATFPKKNNEISKLEKIQFAAIRLALGYRISTSTNILIVKSKLLLFQDKARYLCFQSL